MKILVIGLTITSSWGNGHATTYRALCSALHRRGHEITFFEKDVSWYRDHRDLADPAFCKVQLYEAWNDVGAKILKAAQDSEIVVIGSYCKDGIEAIDLLLGSCKTPVMFYDIDTPVTLAALRRDGAAEYLRAEQIPGFAAYLTFSGGNSLVVLKKSFGAQQAFPLYCSADCQTYQPTSLDSRFACDLSYLGTYASDRQPKLINLLNTPAQQLSSQSFIVAGPQYPETPWASNVRRFDHVPPGDHPAFYSSSRFTLNLTRADMVEAGYSPSVRLFEAAACGSPILTDSWDGIDSFFIPHEQILLVESADDVTRILRDVDEAERKRIAESARQQVLDRHSSDQRALEFEQIVESLSVAANSGAS